MQSTVLKNVVLTQPQDQNPAGGIFGGFLLRQGLEIAHSCAALYLSSVTSSNSSSRSLVGSESSGPMTPRLLHVDDALFLQPVLAGSVVSYRAQILYTHRASMTVRVVATAHNLKSHSTTDCNHFDFVFLADQVAKSSNTNSAAASGNLKDGSDSEDSEIEQLLGRHIIVPRTYHESIQHLDGKRVFLRSREDLKRLGSAYAGALEGDVDAL